MQKYEFKIEDTRYSIYQDGKSWYLTVREHLCMAETFRFDTYEKVLYEIMAELEVESSGDAIESYLLNHKVWSVYKTDGLYSIGVHPINGGEETYYEATGILDAYLKILNYGEDDDVE